MKTISVRFKGTIVTVTLGLPGTHPGPAEDGDTRFELRPDQAWRTVGISKARLEFLTLAIADWQGLAFDGAPVPCTQSAVRVFLTDSSARWQIDRALRAMETETPQR